MITKNNYFTCFIFFLQFYLTSLRGKEYFAKLTNSQEPEPVGAGCFWLPGAGAGATWKKNQEPEPLGKKIRSRSRLKKKSGAGAGAAKKFAGSPALIQRPESFYCILFRHHVRLDASFSSVVLAIAVIEGLARTLNPDLDLLTRALPFLVLP